MCSLLLACISALLICLCYSTLQSREHSAWLTLLGKRGKTSVSSSRASYSVVLCSHCPHVPAFLGISFWPAVRDCLTRGCMCVCMHLCIFCIKAVVGVWLCRMWHTSCCKARARIRSDFTLKITLCEQQNLGLSRSPDLRNIERMSWPHQRTYFSVYCGYRF